MTEDFVSFDLAKKLKEKNFIGNVEIGSQCGFYYKDGEDIDVFYDCYDNADVAADEYLRPTISQVLKWLREEKNIFVEPCVLADADTDADGKVINEYTYWSFIVTNIETGDVIYSENERIDDKRFDSYEQAAIAGIEYVIDNLI